MLRLFLVALGLLVLVKVHAGNAPGRGVWFESQLPLHRAVALVAHGLNLKPEKMDWIAGHLQQSGVDVLRLSFKGHGTQLDAPVRLEEMKKVTAKDWLADFRQGYEEARGRARKLGVPLYLVGYSLGALVGEVLLGNGEVRFDRAVLFAPALTPRWRTRFLIRSLGFFGAGMMIPSANRPEYRANPGTSLAAYRALLDLADQWQRATDANLNIPTLVFIDPEDEGLDYGALLKAKSSRGLRSWEIVPVAAGSSRSPEVIHHLIIDAPSVGQEQWRGMMLRLDQHLKLPGDSNIEKK